MCGGGNARGSRGGPDQPDMEDSGSALEKNVADLTVMDVYDIAAVVGQEFERIIDQYGCEALSRLMPKVVRVLEILEVMVSRSSIPPETEELRLELDKLRVERLDRLEKEKKHRKVTGPRIDTAADRYRWDRYRWGSIPPGIDTAGIDVTGDLLVTSCSSAREQINRPNVTGTQSYCDLTRAAVFRYLLQ